MNGANTVVAYLGPSLEVEAARAILPQAHFEGPVRRGDLYRVRNQGALVFLIVDGRFFQEDALPPREVIDVVRDGALVYGASSIGALRAAECWPVGARGVGLIYRLFRSGRLQSDDEVAVATDPDHGFRATSIALVNVRYAMARAVRTGRLDRPGAANILECASRLFYPDRTWPGILAAAGHATDTKLAKFCAGIDLKRDDALRLFRTVATAVTSDRGFVERYGRIASEPLAPRERQPLPDPLMGRSPEACQADLVRWMVGTGRWAFDRPPVAVTPVGAWTVATVVEPGFGRWLWSTLVATGDLDAELMRMHAVDEAGAEARRRQLHPRPLDRYLAEAEIAARYRSTSWDELQRMAEQLRLPWSWIDEAAHRLALAKRLRAELLHPPAAPAV